MASTYPKASRSLVYWSMLIGAILIGLYAVRTLYWGGYGPSSTAQNIQPSKPDDISTLEKDLGELGKDPVADEVAELGQATK